MFICDKCLRNKFQNGESIFKSHGNCEICNEKAVCSEIHSSRLTRKPKIDPVTGLTIFGEDA